MDILSSQLQVLTKAVRYENLTGASQHVGLSQPQLSRIIKQLEENLGVTLLDRTSRRQTRWTTQAKQIAELFKHQENLVKAEISKIITGGLPEAIHIGSLEGLIPLACQLGHFLLAQFPFAKLRISVVDLDLLEEQFFKTGYDLVITSREPGKKKHDKIKVLGHQEFKEQKSNNQFKVLSSFEFEGLTQKQLKDPSQYIISNSLQVRKYWLSNFDSSGRLPDQFKVSSKPTSSSHSVLAIGTEGLNAKIWEKVRMWIPSSTI